MKYRKMNFVFDIVYLNQVGPLSTPVAISLSLTLVLSRSRCSAG